MTRGRTAWLFVGLGLIVLLLSMDTVAPIVSSLYKGNTFAIMCAAFWAMFGLLCLGDLIAGKGAKVKGKAGAWVMFAGLSVALVYFALPTRTATPGLVAINTQPLMPAAAQVAPTAIPTQPTAQPVPTVAVAQPETNGADVGVVAVKELGRAVEREQRQNEVLAQRPSADLLIVALVIIGILVAVVVMVLGGRRNQQAAQLDPGYRIQSPTTPAQLKPGDWFEVNGKLFQVPEIPAANAPKQIGKRR